LIIRPTHDDRPARKPRDDRFQHRSQRLAIAVEDDGPGLSAEERRQLFQRGKRLDEAVPGSGLGLAIVRDIAALYDGSVALDESPLGGLKVTLTLPAADARVEAG